jgi:hypothetical protein
MRQARFGPCPNENQISLILNEGEPIPENARGCDLCGRVHVVLYITEEIVEPAAPA